MDDDRLRFRRLMDPRNEPLEIRLRKRDDEEEETMMTQEQGRGLEWVAISSVIKHVHRISESETAAAAWGEARVT